MCQFVTPKSPRNQSRDVMATIDREAPLEIMKGGMDQMVEWGKGVWEAETIHLEKPLAGI